MSDPWLITRPILLSVSGGRTSMHMLWRYLQRHDGQLPEQAVAVFCNTGKEHPATLDFVQRCSTEWGVHIVWLEYIDAEEPAQRFQVVSHNSASRDGEPFAAVIKRKGYLPNTMSRFCTTELKVHCSHRWARAEWEHGASRYAKAIGFRADEPHRVAKARVRCGQRKDAWDLAWPLFDEGIRKAHILAWWRKQPFDLGIPERLGNCDLCFLKSRHKVGKNIEENPAIADWWIKQENFADDTMRSRNRPLASVADLRAWALDGQTKPWDQAEIEGLDAFELECTCTD